MYRGGFGDGDRQDITMRIVLVEDGWDKFRPLTITRPLAEIRVGAMTFVERIERLFPDSRVSVMTRPYVNEAYRARWSRLVGRVPEGEGGLLVLRPNAIYDFSFREAVLDAGTGTLFRSENNVLGVLIDGDEIPDRLESNGYKELEVGAIPIPAIWDAVNLNGDAIKQDFEEFYKPERAGTVHPMASLYDEQSIFISGGTEIMAGAVLDAREGPIIIENSEIRPGTIIQGPCYIGSNCVAVSGWIRQGCSFGPGCRFGGEVESSIFQGCSNKYHEGFLGHSYIGEWVNLGALTTTSDLKNNYGEIRVDMGDGQVRTGRIKVGSFIGDHSKTGIGALLNSGTCIGVNVNHYGTGLPPKNIPHFSWGTAEGYIEYDLEKAIATAKIVMERRGVIMLEEEEQMLRAIFSTRKVQI